MLRAVEWEASGWQNALRLFNELLQDVQVDLIAANLARLDLIPLLRPMARCWRAAKIAGSARSCS